MKPIRVRGDVSSQFLSALLLALPLVADRDLVVEVEGPLISQPYVAITLALQARFGVQVQHKGWQRFTIPAHSRYVSPGRLVVEGDASSASYFIALGAIAAHQGAPVRIDGVGTDSIQGDIAFVDAARAMGARVRGGPGWLEDMIEAEKKGYVLPLTFKSNWVQYQKQAAKNWRPSYRYYRSDVLKHIGCTL